MTIRSVWPLTIAQVERLVAAVGLRAQELDFGLVDLRRGLGVLGPKDRCVWLRDGRRIDVRFPSAAGFATAICTDGPDPDAPAYLEEAP